MSSCRTRRLVRLSSTINASLPTREPADCPGAGAPFGADSQHCSEGERRADAVVLADAEIAAHRLGQPPTNHQPETRPAVRPGSGAVDLAEGLEQPVHPVAWDADGPLKPRGRVSSVRFRNRSSP